MMQEQNGQRVKELGMTERGADEWLASYSTKNVNSLNGLATHLGIARRFATEKGYTKPFLEMTVKEASALATAMRGRGWSSSIFGAVRSFYKAHEMMSHADKFKLRQKRPRMAPDELLSTDEVNALIESARSGRDRALLAVMADTGARIHEVMALRLGDVSTVMRKKNGSGEVKLVKLFFTKSKTVGNERYVELEPEASAIVLKFLGGYPSDVRGGDERPVFPSHALNAYGKPMHPHGWEHRMKEIALAAGITKRVHPHQMRHYMATRLLRAGVPEQIVKARGGWAAGSPMLSRYSHLVDEDVSDEIARRNGFEVEHREAERIAVPVSEVPAMPAHPLFGSKNLDAIVEDKLRALVASGGLVVKPGGAVDLNLDDGSPGD